MAQVRAFAAASPTSAAGQTESGGPGPEIDPVPPSVHAERDAETAELFAALAAAPDGRSRAVALEHIVLLYLDLCGSMASRYDGRGIEHDDLVQVARLALVKAIDRYVPGQGPSFAAFAVPTISGELKRHFRDRGWMVRPPRRLQEMRVQVQSCRNRLEQEVGHSPTRRRGGPRAGRDASSRQGGRRGIEQLPPDLARRQHDRRRVRFGRLPARRRRRVAGPGSRTACASRSPLRASTPTSEQLLALRYVDELTQREIGARLGMSQMQVSRALRRLVAHLRVALADDPTTGRRRLGQAS